MRKLLLTILCLCSFQSVAVATEQQLLLGALRGPAYDTAIALAMELSETLKRPVVVKGFEDETTMYVWLERYRMIDFALTSRAELAPGQLHRLGSVPVADNATSIDLVGHSGLPREVLLQVRNRLADESPDSLVEALPSRKNGAEVLTPEPAALSPEKAVETASAVPKDDVEAAPAAQSLPDADDIKSFLSHLDPGQDSPERGPLEKEPADSVPGETSEAALAVPVDVVEADPTAPEERVDTDNITGLLSHWGLAEEASEEAPLADKSETLTPEGFSSEPEDPELVTPEPVVTMPSPEESTAVPTATEEQSAWGGIGAMLSHWGAPAEDPSERGMAPAEDAPPPSLEPLPATPATPVEAVAETSDMQSTWGSIGDLFNQWGADTEEAVEQADAVATVVMDVPQPRSFDAPAETVASAPVAVAEPSGPLVVHLVPMTRVMLPERVENRLLEEFSRLLQQQELPKAVRFVELDKPLSQIEPSWLEQHHSLAGEIFGYKEKTGRLSTILQLRGRLYYRAPAQTDSPWQEEVPVKVSFDPDESSLEEAQDRLVVELAAVLVEAFLAELSLE